MIKHGTRWMISYYTNLLHTNRIKVAGKAHERLKQLKLKYSSEKKS